MSGEVENVTITLPNGALAGWPTLIDALCRAREATGLDMVFGGLIEQIQEQTAPKPPEPTGLGAVVENEKGERFVRWKARGRADRHWKGEGDGDYRAWSHIDAVKVLSEGVTS